MSIETILIILLIVWLVGSLPLFPYSQQWGYSPIRLGLPGIILVIVLIMYFTGNLHLSHR